MTGVDGNSHRFYVLISPPSLQYLGRTPCEPRHLVYPLPHFSFGPHKLLPPEYPQNLTRSGKTILLSLCPSTQQSSRFGRHGPCLQRSLPTQSLSRGQPDRRRPSQIYAGVTSGPDSLLPLTGFAPIALEGMQPPVEEVELEEVIPRSRSSRPILGLILASGILS